MLRILEPVVHRLRQVRQQSGFESRRQSLLHVDSGAGGALETLCFSSWMASSASSVRPPKIEFGMTGKGSCRIGSLLNGIATASPGKKRQLPDHANYRAQSTNGDTASSSRLPTIW